MLDQNHEIQSINVNIMHRNPPINWYYYTVFGKGAFQPPSLLEGLASSNTVMPGTAMIQPGNAAYWLLGRWMWAHPSKNRSKKRMHTLKDAGPELRPSLLLVIAPTSCLTGRWQFLSPFLFFFFLSNFLPDFLSLSPSLFLFVSFFECFFFVKLSCVIGFLPLIYWVDTSLPVLAVSTSCRSGPDRRWWASRTSDSRRGVSCWWRRVWGIATQSSVQMT